MNVFIIGDSEGGFKVSVIFNTIDQSPRNYLSLVFIGSKCQFTKRGRGGTDLP